MTQRKLVKVVVESVDKPVREGLGVPTEVYSGVGPMRVYMPREFNEDKREMVRDLVRSMHEELTLIGGMDGRMVPEQIEFTYRTGPARRFHRNVRIADDTNRNSRTDESDVVFRLYE